MPEVEQVSSRKRSNLKIIEPDTGTLVGQRPGEDSPGARLSQERQRFRCVFRADEDHGINGTFGQRSDNICLGFGIIVVGA
ncbi:hypothetical protein Tamer19_72030 [Cupriavidus sp. TA19]|nr:hypothetical protein Tamer19_72030 [Cupriavidus sp. TA19]